MPGSLGRLPGRGDKKALRAELTARGGRSACLVWTKTIICKGVRGDRGEGVKGKVVGESRHHRCREGKISGRRAPTC